MTVKDAKRQLEKFEDNDVICSFDGEKEIAFQEIDLIFKIKNEEYLDKFKETKYGNIAGMIKK